MCWKKNKTCRGFSACFQYERMSCSLLEFSSRGCVFVRIYSVFNYIGDYIADWGQMLSVRSISGEYQSCGNIIGLLSFID